MSDDYSLSVNLDEPAVSRGWAARILVAEDARWAADLALSGRAVQTPYPVLLLGHHVIRIAYEGAIALRSPNPHVGLPPLADFLEEQFGAITRRVRNLTKLLDDKSRGYDGVVTDLETERQAHRDYMAGPIGRLIGLPVADLGVYTIDEQVVGVTVPMGYRLAMDPRGSIGQEAISEVTEEWGGTLAALAAASLTPLELTPTLDFTAVRVDEHDVVASDYLDTRYDPGLREGVKLLLLMIEGDLNTVRLFLPHASHGHEMPAFRARAVTVRHCLSALREISDRHPDIVTPEMRSLRRVLDGAPSQRLLSREGGLVRNRCVHYEMNDPRVVPRLDAPMFGLVEAVFPESDFDRFAADLATVTTDLSGLLDEWTA